MKQLTAILALALCTLTASAQSTARKFVLQNSADGESQLTVYLPAADKANGKAVVGCPGGGYSHLAMDHEGYDWAEYYNSQGIAYAVLKYRMPKGDRNIPLSDAYNAIKTVRDSAEVWHVNPHAVGIQGFSAGGHLASAVSTHAPFASRPDFSILFYPVISMNEKITHKGSCQGFLGDGRSDERLVREWSSDKAVRRHLTPPAIILTANDDRVVPPVTNGIAYYSAMRNAGNDCSLFVYPSGGHGFGFRTTWPYHDQMLGDLTSWLNSVYVAGANDRKIACVGNSITDGHGIDMCDLIGYPAQLRKLLGEGNTVKNFGVSARTMLNKGDHPYMQELAWEDCIAWQPDVVVIKLGTNDSKEAHRQYLESDFARDMQQMIGTLRSLPNKPRIYVCSPIPAFKDTWTISDAVISETIIPTLREMAELNQCEFIDLHETFSKDGNDINGEGMKMMQSDGIHPNDKGVTRIANLVAEAIKSAPKYPVYDEKKFAKDVQKKAKADKAAAAAKAKAEAKKAKKNK